jgi:hypothetical protein
MLGCGVGLVGGIGEHQRPAVGARGPARGRCVVWPVHLPAHLPSRRR